MRGVQRGDPTLGSWRLAHHALCTVNPTIRISAEFRPLPVGYAPSRTKADADFSHAEIRHPRRTYSAATASASSRSTSFTPACEQLSDPPRSPVHSPA